MYKNRNFKPLYIILSFLLIIIFISGNIQAMKLEHGDRGEKVRETQKYLSHLGYDIDVDGIYGYRTREIVKDFQKSNGLKVDGITGDKTFEALVKYTEDIKYEVKRGDTLSEIAIAYDTTVEAIKDRNNLNSNKIKIGQVLYIRKTGVGGGEEEKIYNNIIHTVQRGDVLSIIAHKYGSDVETIKLANNLRNNVIYVGQELVIPHLRQGANKPFKLAKGSIIWPILGRLTSGFGYRTHPIKNTREFHQGIDIAAPIGKKIRAAAAGKVTRSGWVSGFGKVVVIDHGQGVKTLYGHNSRLYVSVGERVNIGEVIAAAGSTGRSTGSHLHFGILVNEKPVNPLKYLP